jgi:TRAP-type uncharacterized transport system substrate-binding protein
MLVVAPADAVITEFAQLDGKKVFAGPEDSWTASLFALLAAAYDIGPQPVYGTWLEGADALRTGDVAAACVSCQNGKHLPTVFAQMYEYQPFLPLAYDAEILNEITPPPLL